MRGCLTAYRQLLGLRREWPDLTDPAFDRTSCVVDEESRVFQMARGRLLIVVNFGAADARLEVGRRELLFETEAGVDLGERLFLPGHAGALLGPVAPD